MEWQLDGGLFGIVLKLSEVHRQQVKLCYRTKVLTNASMQQQIILKCVGYIYVAIMAAFIVFANCCDPISSALWGEMKNLAG